MNNKQDHKFKINDFIQRIVVKIIIWRNYFGNPWLFLPFLVQVPHHSISFNNLVTLLAICVFSVVPSSVTSLWAWNINTHFKASSFFHTKGTTNISCSKPLLNFFFFLAFWLKHRTLYVRAVPSIYDGAFCEIS